MLNFYDLHLLPGDRVLIPKSLFNLVQHHAIYAGKGWFYENVIGKGVVLTHYARIFKDGPSITSISRLNANDHERHLALRRAQKLIGTPYHLTNFNCEHFANYVQYGRSGSKQVESVIGLGAVALFVIATVRASR